MNTLIVKKQLEQFFIEDLGELDVSSQTAISPNAQGKAKIVAKENGIMAGIDLLRVGYDLLDSGISVQFNKKDGEFFEKGENIALLEGNVISLLAGERVLLNLLQRMSGIATMTNSAIRTINDDTIRICDTRKTTPGLRMFEKYAVRCGGGFNHRRGLSDAVMLKENHLLAGGGIKKAVDTVRRQVGHMVKIEVETTNEQEVKEAVDAKVDVIMFDNASPSEITHYMTLVPDSIITEASGGITLENLATFRGTGVDYISLGCLTHSVKAVDISFLLEEGI
ncbi:carboxylating nicotinate-nucleotide diphosphorylase [Alkalihalobacillus sp. MEB130]|uniref:carboxylating nicotinate-nucleotide diphosphorylase n=1 Tax=Alkalihalobacillus sp. MEB130 TaxID=2976704 RepID=UPI0028DE0AD2|nr:carboxylating nicotinate-nucleotide diphosphorylase [Alkalihalobacillus sp. MEB130]MDT8861985.1 carboxylating nicotinate-nucleotide diphosphorylase [Alkalihalobacillus sp. MEB130]